jgi:hypothetical protein
MTKAVQLGCQAQRTLEAVQTWSSRFPRTARFTSPSLNIRLRECPLLISVTCLNCFSRRFSCKYIFIHLCPGVNYQYLWSPLFLQSFMVCLAVPSQIWCHINGCSHPGTAHCMAASFPSISLWPDTYTSYNMQCSASFLSECWRFQMN